MLNQNWYKYRIMNIMQTSERSASSYICAIFPQVLFRLLLLRSRRHDMAGLDNTNQLSGFQWLLRLVNVSLRIILHQKNLETVKRKAPACLQ
jgi:hypothetical protein